MLFDSTLSEQQHAKSKFMLEQLKQGRFAPSAKTHSKLYTWQLHLFV